VRDVPTLAQVKRSESWNLAGEIAYGFPELTILACGFFGIHFFNSL